MPFPFPTICCRPFHMPSIVRVQRLIKNYYLGAVTVNVLKGIDLEIEQGDFVALMGPSGSGKSTLLNILGCLDRPTTGEYILSGRNVAHLNDDRLSDVRGRYLGFIFQSYNLLPQYTVVENIEVPLLYQGIPLDERTRQRCVGLGGDGRPRRPARPSARCNCPAASSSAWPSPAPWSTTRT